MKKEKEALRSYYDAVQPSENFQEKLLALKDLTQKSASKASKTKPVWRYVAALAACIGLFLVGWFVLGLQKGDPNIVPPTDKPVQNEAPAESHPPETAPVELAPASETEPTEDPTETEAATPTRPDKNPAEAGEMPSEPEPKETNAPASNPTVPAATPTESAPAQTERPTMFASSRPSGLDADPMPSEEPSEEPISLYGWYQRTGSREYICIQNAATGEVVRINVTGQLHAGYLSLQSVVFGVTVQVEVFGYSFPKEYPGLSLPGESDGPSNAEEAAASEDAVEDLYDVTITIL